jgi:hypothetical protein
MLVLARCSSPSAPPSRSSFAGRAGQAVLPLAYNVELIKFHCTIVLPRELEVERC